MRTFAALIGVLAGFSAGATASVITFTDRATFEAATGAALVGPIPELPSGTEFTIGDLEFLNVAPSSLNTTRDWSTKISEDFDLAINGVENFDVESLSPLHSFGFDFHEPTEPSPIFPDTCNAPCFDSSFEMTVFNGAVPIASHVFTRPQDSLEFVGIWTSDAFNRIEIRELVGGIDNEFFGNFTIGTTPASEPTSLVVLGAALAILGFARRRSA